MVEHSEHNPEAKRPELQDVEAALELAAAAINESEDPQERADIVNVAQRKLEPLGVVVHDVVAAPAEERRNASGLTREQLLHERDIARRMRSIRIARLRLPIRHL